MTALIRLILDRPCATLLRSYHCRFCHGYHFGHYGEAPATPFVPKPFSVYLRERRAKRAQLPAAANATPPVSDHLAAA